MNNQPSKEQIQERPIFEIDPGLGGYYASGRKSYFDIDTKTWSKKKVLASYAVAYKEKDRHTISGFIDSGLKAIMDVLTGIVYLDDKQVYEITILKDFDKKDPRVEIIIEGVENYE